MIGQTDLLDKLKQQVDDGIFPKFTMIVGSKGSGKSLLMQEIAEYLGCQIHRLEDVKIDTIRDMIEESTKKAGSGANIVYIITDAENMSVAAKNSILKITEEPPKGAYFIMSVSNEEEMLDTIKNRAAIYRMRPYTKSEKQEYLDSLGASLDDADEDLILQTANTLSDIEKLVKMRPGALKEYVDNFIKDLMSDKSPAILLNYAKEVAFKDDSGYDLELLWRMFCIESAKKSFDLVNKDSSEAYMYGQMISKTVEKMGDLRSNSVSKANTFDIWILDCRKIVRKWKSEN